MSLFAVVTSVEISARDSNLSLAPIGLAIIIIYNSGAAFSARNKICLAAIITVLIVLQLPSASARHLLNTLSTLAGVVLPDETIRTYYAAHGMPSALASAGSHMQPQPLGAVNLTQLRQQQAIVLKIAPDFVFEADKIYTMYLLSHPSYIIYNTIKYHELIFDPVIWPVSPGLGTAPAFLHPEPDASSPVIFPSDFKVSPTDYIPFPEMLTIILAYSLYVLVFARSFTMILPLIFVAAGASNATLSFFGALWEHSEMVRHAMIGSILFKIGGCLSIAFFMDHLLTQAPRTKWLAQLLRQRSSGPIRNNIPAAESP